MKLERHRNHQTGARFMGVLDTEGKKYLSNSRIFADAFNFLIYDGEQVIKADALRELDTTQIAIPYGNQARVPVQKYRDILKLWNAMMDDDMIYVILGGEVQGKVHYGMPVKDGLYDMIGYSNQIDEARRSYRAKDGKADEDADISIEEGNVKIKLTSEEFLSGFRKEDKLIPIVTAVIYLGAEPWDGPRSLHDMMDIKDERVKKFVPDYRINLISPADMDEEEFERFHTDFGFAMKVIKYQKKNADRIIEGTKHKKIDRDTAVFLNKAVNLELEYEEKEGDIDMCEAMEKRDQRMKVTGAIEILKESDISDDSIVERIVKKFNVTKEYVLELLSPQAA